MDRRRFLFALGASAAAMSCARVAFAKVPSENRMVVIVLRGGLDGLHAMAPYADQNYRNARPTLALAAPGMERGVLDLNGYFGLHSALAPLHQLFAAKELLLIPAASTRYRQRSHFDGQNMLENGSDKPFGARDGWLNRAILGLAGGDRKLGLALGPAVPLILQGDARIQSWAGTKLPSVDDDFMSRLSLMYKSDPLFAKAIEEAQSSLKPDMSKNMMDVRSGSVKESALTARAAADLLSRDEGPRIAAMEIQGWDTHFNQESRLRGLFTQLSESVVELKNGMGQAWSKTAVIIVSEFGRTVLENGSGGTDHGTGGLAMLAGGAVAGGKIIGNWPGLSASALFEGRDVHALNDYESLFKSMLVSHMGLSQSFVEDQIFPRSRAAKPIDGLFRGA